jgi:hypothetical protein
MIFRRCGIARLHCGIKHSRDSKHAEQQGDAMMCMEIIPRKGAIAFIDGGNKLFVSLLDWEWVIAK